MAFGLAVYASPSLLPHSTQNSLPVAGQALLDGISTRKVPMKGFKVVDYISFSFPKLSWRKRCNRCSEEIGLRAGGVLHLRKISINQRPPKFAPLPASVARLQSLIVWRYSWTYAQSATRSREPP
jgi:hypothetical protein